MNSLRLQLIGSRRLRLFPFLKIALCLLLFVQPEISCAQGAKSYITVDAHTQQILGGSQINLKTPVASLTKVATACVVLDWAKGANKNLAQLATVPPSAQVLQGQNAVGLRPGDQMTLRDLLCSAMMSSDNMAAQTLAHHVGSDLLRIAGRTGEPVGYFIQQMNALAAHLNMTDTKFVNPHGLDYKNPVPLSTAADMARLSIYAISLPAFRFYMEQSTREVTIFRGGQKIPLRLHNTNQLLGTEGIDGMKTGMTARAGGCVILTSERKPTRVSNPETGQTEIQRHRLITVVLGSSDRMNLGRGLLRNGWAAYDQWVSRGRPRPEARNFLSISPK